MILSMTYNHRYQIQGVCKNKTKWIWIYNREKRKYMAKIPKINTATQDHDMPFKGHLNRHVCLEHDQMNLDLHMTWLRKEMDILS